MQHWAWNRADPSPGNVDLQHFSLSSMFVFSVCGCVSGVCVSVHSGSKSERCCICLWKIQGFQVSSWMLKRTRVLLWIFNAVWKWAMGIYGRPRERREGERGGEEDDERSEGEKGLGNEGEGGCTKITGIWDGKRRWRSVQRGRGEEDMYNTHQTLRTILRV